MVPEGFKPQLAINFENVTKPPQNLYMSEKLDGVRCIFFGGVAYSRSLKPLPNLKLQAFAKQNADMLEGCDGEVISGDLYDKGVLQNSVSFCMGVESDTDFHVYIFDKYHTYWTWYERYHSLLNTNLPVGVSILPHYPVESQDQLDQFEQSVLSRGGEGVMLRDPQAAYKCGRSGKVNPSLSKLKRFTDDEFIVVGYEQFESNQNEAKTNELGRTQRSTSKEGKVALQALGSLILKTKDGIVFNCGTGFTEEQRNQLWQEKDSLAGKLAKVKFFHYSKDNVPLLPVFLGFRNEIDM